MRDVGDEHRFPLALVEQAAEVGLAEQLRQLVVRAEIGRRERGKRSRVEGRRITGLREQLTPAINQQRRMRAALLQQALHPAPQGLFILGSECPAGCADHHLLDLDVWSLMANRYGLLVANRSSLLACYSVFFHR